MNSLEPEIERNGKRFVKKNNIVELIYFEEKRTASFFNRSLWVAAAFYYIMDVLRSATAFGDISRNLFPEVAAGGRTKE
jgi:hypothetical protein